MQRFILQFCLHCDSTFHLCVALHPAVFVGENDAALGGRTSERRHVPVEEYKDNLKRIVHHLKVGILHSICYFEILMSNIWFPCCLSKKKKKRGFHVSNSTFQLFIVCLDALESWPK